MFGVCVCIECHRVNIHAPQGWIDAASSRSVSAQERSNCALSPNMKAKAHFLQRFFSLRLYFLTPRWGLLAGMISGQYTAGLAFRQARCGYDHTPIKWRAQFPSTLLFLSTGWLAGLWYHSNVYTFFHFKNKIPFLHRGIHFQLHCRKRWMLQRLPELVRPNLCKTAMFDGYYGIAALHCDCPK